MNIGVVGVGRMGANMARRLKDRNLHVTAVYDSNRKVATDLAGELSCAAAQDLSEVTADANGTESDRSCSQRGLRRLPSAAHCGASFLLSRGLQLNRETLRHQSDRRGNTVQVYPLRIQRQYTRFRRPGRQPPHPGRHRSQPARLQSPQPASDVFRPRPATAHLARLKIFIKGPAIYAKPSTWSTVESRKRVCLCYG